MKPGPLYIPRRYDHTRWKGTVSDVERSMIQERVRAGLKRAKAERKQLGRPSVSTDVEQRIRAPVKAGKSIRKTAEECGVNPSTVQKVKRPFDADSIAA